MIKIIAQFIRTKKKIVVAVLCGLVLFLGIRYLTRPLTPDMICQQTMNALKNQDAETLLRLADTAEIKQLELTAKKIDGIFQDLQWKQIYTGDYSSKLYMSKTPDSVVYAIKEKSLPEGSRQTIYINALDDPKTGWHLNLSNLIYFISIHTHTKKRNVNWKAMVEKHKLLGTRQWKGDILMYGVGGYEPRFPDL